VVVRGENDDELVELIEFGRRVGAEVRFIEYMDVGGATQWRPDRVVGRDEVLARIQAHYGGIEATGKDGAAPADRWRLPDGTTFGVIASTTAPFCGSCDRSRLTADGTWYLCLYARTGVDLRALLRRGATDAELRAHLGSGWRGRADRGAEDRLALHQRGILAPKSELDADPRLEMHTRGG
jgi:cyclic pyranopterin phosphate synthase